MSSRNLKIEQVVHRITEELKEISLKIHQNPELGFEEFKPWDGRRILPLRRGGSGVGGRISRDSTGQARITLII